MPYLSPQLVLTAAKALEGRPPLGVVTIPALLRAAAQAGVDVTAAPGVEFGGKTEMDLLQEFFMLPRPRESDRPCRAIWDKDLWVKKDYPSKSLQRRRTDFAKAGQIFSQTKAQGHDLWCLHEDAGTVLSQDWAANHGGMDNTVIRLVDLAIWFGRSAEWENLDAAIAWFKSEFEPERADLVGSLYDDSIPPAYATFPMVDEPMDAADYEALGSLPEALTLGGTLSELVERLEVAIKATHFVLPDGLVQRVVRAWMRGDMVILVGQPGTGKTRFATTLAECLRQELGIEEVTLLPVRADFDEAEFVGYERLDGQPQFRKFAERVLLTDRPLEPQIVILEEFNLATVESYLSGVLSALQETSRSVPLPGGGTAALPVDAFFIATCNSYRDEPETRSRVSSPTKRRSTTISMPNVLSVRVDELPGGVDDPGFPSLITDLALELLAAESARVKARIDGDNAVTFDAARMEAIGSVQSASDLTEMVRGGLAKVAAAILGTPEGRTWFTLGLLRDVILVIAYASRGDEQAELEALVSAVVDKLLHQLRGPHENADVLLAAVGGMPGAEDVAELIARMKSSGALDELLPLL